MEIKLNAWEIEEAIFDFIKKDKGIVLDRDKMQEHLCLDYNETKFAYKKHKNGKLKKCKDGYSIIDHENSKDIKKYAFIDECATISFYLD